MKRAESRDQNAIPLRPRLGLGENLEKNLLSYAAAASAAGVALLAGTPRANAEIVYTYVREPIGASTFLDLNGDGINDFQFTLIHTSHCEGVCTTTLGRHHKTAFNSQNGWLRVYGLATGNQPVGNVTYASALRVGNPVGAGRAFGTGKIMARAHDINGMPSDNAGYGPWAGTAGTGTYRFLGLKFLISGQTHYGWARVHVSITTGGNIAATLVSYAYETVANQPIAAGKRAGASASINPGDADPLAPAPASLGLLARGETGLAIWRRDEEATALPS